MENTFLTDAELPATVADIKAVIKGSKGDKGDTGDFPQLEVGYGSLQIKGRLDGTNDYSFLSLKGTNNSFYRWINMNNILNLEYFPTTGVGTQIIRCLTDGTVSKIGGGSFAALSDSRLKKEILSFASGLEKVLAIQPKRFKYNAVAGTPTENYPAIITDKQQYGVIAQDLQTVCPEMVTADENGFLSVDLSNLSLLLINAVKELNTKIGSLEARILTLETPKA